MPEESDPNCVVATPTMLPAATEPTSMRPSAVPNPTVFFCFFAGAVPEGAGSESQLVQAGFTGTSELGDDVPHDW
ncbi:hypothetical protein GCM10027580_23520 [Corynebacterium faecale]